MPEHLTAETLCDRISREMLRHGIDWNDGDPRCYCGGPLPESWDQHLAEALAGVFAPELAELATRAEQAETEANRLTSEADANMKIHFADRGSLRRAEAAIERARRVAHVWIDIRPTHPTATNDGHVMAYAGEQIIAALDASQRPEDTGTSPETKVPAEGIPGGPEVPDPEDDEADTQWRRDEREIEGGFTGCEFPRLWPPRQRPEDAREGTGRG